MKTNPEGEWLHEYHEDEQSIYIDEQHGSATSSNIYQRETELYKREKKLASSSWHDKSWNFFEIIATWIV